MNSKFLFVLLFVLPAFHAGLFANNENSVDKKEINKDAILAAAQYEEGQAGISEISIIRSDAAQISGEHYLGNMRADVSLQNSSSRIVLFLIAFCVLMYGVIITVPKNMRIQDIDDLP